ncbi:uncharacterized protein LOC100250970 isoform X2 [Vitis vinifera]|uniref:uncharacterized protein LOC100250970 isoform X2 n=1 Tax=Vitis vinifera TaxID=29760 RepID=UPI0008FEC6A0|nr:uncharacterized protein LOC100250970 isoform X2 [Vitis vinifera]|eukprot:XP_019072096.1 PREDICTED: uncharacterized protein LOC100250970 isoform X2 [Vitis vinifera]
MAATTCRALPTISSLHSSFTTTTLELPAPSTVFFRPKTRFSRLRVSPTTTVAPKYGFRVLAASGFRDGNSEANLELGPSVSSSSHSNSVSDDSCSEASIDIKLPRRSLIVQFTCDACGERTERLINRLAFERGTVFVQAVLLISVQGVFSITNWLII